jgi:hypothetical protein
VSKVKYPLSKLAIEIHKTKLETFVGNNWNIGKIVPYLVGFTTKELRDIDYCFIAQEYEATLEKQLYQMGMLNESQN